MKVSQISDWDGYSVTLQEERGDVSLVSGFKVVVRGTGADKSEAVAEALKQLGALMDECKEYRQKLAGL